MPTYLQLGEGGLVKTEDIIALGRARSAPLQRLLKTTPPERLLDLTYGHPRNVILILRGGYVVVATPTLEEVSAMLSGVAKGYIP